MERAYSVLQVALLYLSLLVLNLPGGEVMAQRGTADALANGLRGNVVRVASRWDDGTSNEYGFGFIVGQRSGLLYIVTANHVVRNKNLVAGTPGITFFQDQGKEYPGAVLTTYLEETAGDVAVIRVQVPPDLAWRAEARSSVAAERSDDVRIIGIQGQWLVPVRPGAVESVEPNGTIYFEGLPIRKGTSGAPLIGDTGILGMVTTDADVYALATPIDVIERAFRGWSYPWDLAKWTPAPPPAPTLPGPLVVSPPGGSPPVVSPPIAAAPVPVRPAAPPIQTESWASHYTTRDNRDLWLGDIQRSNKVIGTRNVDLDQCGQECTNNRDCVAFSYDRWNRACYPKNKLTQSVLDPHSMIAVKKPDELPNVSQTLPLEMVPLRNQRMRGDVTISKKTADYPTCSSACQNNLQCVAFNFLKRSGGADNCQMFKLSDGHDNNNTVDAGYKHQVP